MNLGKYDNLIKQALTVRDNAYAPYSKYRVGSALMTKGGAIYTGCNVENAAYGETICAERVALTKAVSEGERDFAAICVVGGIDGVKDFAFPCGACRQVMSELCPPSLRIVLFDGTNVKVCTLGELFPASFGKGNIQ